MYRLRYITLKRLVRIKGDPSKLIEQLAEMPTPGSIRIGWKRYGVPQNLNDFRDAICWGQRLMMATPHKTDFETFMYFVCNYYQPIVTKKPFDEQLVMRLYRKIVNCNISELYPVAMHFVKLFNEMIDIEQSKLNSTPDAMMRAAGIDSLSIFSDLAILKLVANECKVKLNDAHLVDYNTVFSLLYEAKLMKDFTETYNQLLISKNEKHT
jgi:hypothetical protein